MKSDQRPQKQVDTEVRMAISRNFRESEWDLAEELVNTCRKTEYMEKSELLTLSLVQDVFLLAIQRSKNVNELCESLELALRDWPSLLRRIPTDFVDPEFQKYARSH